MSITYRDGKPRCSAIVGERVRPDGYGYEPATCRQWRGLTAYTAHDGTVVRYCGATGHRARVERQTARQHAAQLAEANAADAELAARDDRIDADLGTGYIGEFS